MREGRGKGGGQETAHGKGERLRLTCPVAGTERKREWR